MITINYWAVLVAAFVQIAVGIWWYGPFLGKTRDRLQGLPGDAGNGPSMYIASVVNNLLISFVMAIFINSAEAHYQIWTAFFGMWIAFLLWIGIIATREATMSIWEGRPWKVWLINVSYYLVGFLLMGAILGAWY